LLVPPSPLRTTPVQRLVCSVASARVCWSVRPATRIWSAFRRIPGASSGRRTRVERSSTRFATSRHRESTV
jgi:hypothetical protein